MTPHQFVLSEENLRQGLCKVEFIQSFCCLLFRTKFSYNSAFGNPIFRWESCKGSV